MHPSLPDCQLEGYVYCLLFSDRMIKIGQTRYPSSRLGSYRYGNTKELAIQQVWFSPLHARFIENEREILSQVRQASERLGATEYFTGIEIRTVIEMMNGLDFSALTHQDRIELMGRGTECPCRWCTAALYDHQTMQMRDWIDQKDREDYRKSLV